MARSLIDNAQRDRLKQAVASGSRLGATDLRLINMDVYKARLGDEWFKYKPIIHALATAAIKAELGPNDFFVETGDGYGIFFFTQDVEGVQAVSDRIAERLREDLSHEPAFCDPPLGCKAVSVNCDAFLKELDRDESETTSAQPVQCPVAVTTQYFPLWHAKVQRVIGSIHVPQATSRLPGFGDRNYYLPTVQLAQRDLTAFGDMLAEAYKLHKAGNNTTIVFSINFKAFCAGEFHQYYLHALRQTPASLLQYLTPRFVRIPPGTPQTALAAKTQVLGAIFRHVMVHTRPIIDVQALQCVAASIVSTSWSEVQHLVRAERSTRRAGELVQAFGQAARQLRMNGLLESLDTREALDVAISAGADFVSGTAIAAASPVPFQQQPLTLEQIKHAMTARNRN